MVSLIPNYEKQRYVLNSNDDPGDIEFHNGDILYLMDVRQEIIYSEEDNQWYPVPTGGGGIELFYNDQSNMYVKNMEIPIYNRGILLNNKYKNATHLETVRIYEDVSVTGTYDYSQQGAFSDCTALKTAVMECLPKYGHYFFKNCTALETAQLGSVGHPVTSMTTLTFSGCTQSGLTITIYVADDTTLPLSDSPFGATNATIIYRSSTTGEVLTV